MSNTHADKLKAIQEADIYAKGPAYVELWEIIQEQAQRIKELPPQGLLGLIELSQRKFDEVESLAKLNHSLTKEIERWERAYVELWAGALLKAKLEHQKIWFEACNYLAKLAGEEVPPPLKVRSPNPPRNKKKK